jgi:hypothetical protein
MSGSIGHLEEEDGKVRLYIHSARVPLFPMEFAIKNMSSIPSTLSNELASYLAWDLYSINMPYIPDEASHVGSEPLSSSNC